MFSLLKVSIRVDLRFDVSMKNAILVHVIDSFDHLIQVVPNSLLWHVVPATLNRLVHVHIHQFKH